MCWNGIKQSQTAVRKAASRAYCDLAGNSANTRNVLMNEHSPKGPLETMSLSVSEGETAVLSREEVLVVDVEGEQLVSARALTWAT